jgi:apolipoprotein N-acyltransferase
LPTVALALVSGALLALSFPRYGHPAVAWIALSPLLVALARDDRRGSASRGWVLGLLTGAVYFAGTVYWTSGVMAQYGDIALPLAIVIAGLLVAYLALFPALFGAIVGWLLGRLGAPRALLLAPVVWVASELGRTLLFGGFPWALVGYTQTSVLPIAQLASLVGVYGVSGLVVLVNAALALAVVAPGRSARHALVATSALLAVVAGWGTARLAGDGLPSQGMPLRVGLVQGNVPQDRKWDPTYEDEILERYLELTREASERGARLVLWPESATPFYFEESPKAEAVRLLARERGLWLLLGSDEFERLPRPVSYNSAFLVQPDGTTAGVYRKVRLVPFGEYVPFRHVLFFAAPLVEAVSDFAPGESPVMLPFEGHPVSTAICYEVVYPALIREGVVRGSRLLTTITNDAWFGRSSAPWQHFEMAAMRAIEQGRYLARAANTGISGIVDPYGRVLMASELFEEAVMVGEVRLLAHRTVYARIGDVVAYASAAITLLVLTAAWRGQRPATAERPSRAVSSAPEG